MLLLLFIFTPDQMSKDTVQFRIRTYLPGNLPGVATPVPRRRCDQ